MNKAIHRGSETSTKIFDNRTLQTDYATLVPLLRKGMRVLDAGCGTGAISKGIAEKVGVDGNVLGIDNTEEFINSGKDSYRDVPNLQLMYADLFQFQTEEKFDLVVAARVLQWLSNPNDAVRKLASLLKPGGQLSILDYNHEALFFQPAPPESMMTFYRAFLKWRADAGMDNAIADHLRDYFLEAGLQSVEVLNADEVYKKGDRNFDQRMGIWSKVAELKQIVEEGYLKEDERLSAIDNYNRWIEDGAQCMIMKLNEVRGKI
ncbi:MAG TPA: methyltransferase domain-containing protein [Chryseosolibacter sp.]|nr:methyltransferase domain-containing protein [Chryseosolibacter sp.]